MKKLMMAVAIVCAAVGAQAAQIAWGNDTASKIYGLDGTTAISKSNASTWNLVIALLDSDGNTVATGSNPNMTAGVMQGSTWTYTYGTGDGQYQNGDTFTILAKMTVDGKDYEMTVGSFAIAATDNTGKDTFAWASGNYGGLADTPTVGKWSAAAAVPEPTSGLLLALGLCGLALKRKRA